MKIAVLCHYGQEVGGTESYLSEIIPALVSLGHGVALVHEEDGDSDRPPIQTAPGTPVWKVKALGIDRTIANLRSWRPDVLYAHGLTLPDFEEQVLLLAPAILYAHSYYGACISGHKATSFPIIQTCSYRFDSRCIARYFPKRCGGLNPATMLRSYRLQTRRQSTLQRYKYVLTNSEHMAQEFRRYELNARCLYLFARGTPETHTAPLPVNDQPWRLLYMGRMSGLKGGDLLIEAIAKAQKALDRPVHLTFAGSGSEQERWKAQAQDICRKNLKLQIEFSGWLKEKEKEAVLSRTHLHVLPSVWPEPFGLSGLECGLRGIPSVAFSVGGIPEWLTDGFNGYLAPADPATGESLANAIVRALTDPQELQSLQRGAKERTSAFTLDKHLGQLTDIFEELGNKFPPVRSEIASATV